jgi:hypothetical protein
MTPIFPFLTARSTPNFTSRLFSANFGIFSSKFLKSMVIGLFEVFRLHCASSHKVNYPFFVMISSCSIVTSFPLYLGGLNVSLKVIEVKAIGLTL